ncbi:MAG: DUF2336 domain-containing protein [Bosea sp. (in: a-proteobacteria)]
MSAVNALLRDLETSFGTTTDSERAVTVSRLTDLFLVTAQGLTDEQIAVFDVVIGRLASEIETRARAELSHRLADVGNAPHGVVRMLALDEIDVARPVLTRSTRLTEEDLVAVASQKSQDHLLAVTQRPLLSEPVTDFLVLRGNQNVSRAVAGHASAQLSRRGMSLLVTRARRDESLVTLLSERGDVPAELMSQLVAVAKDAARQRLVETVSAEEAVKAEAAVNGAAQQVVAPDAAAEVGAEVQRYEAALAEVRALEAARKLNQNEIQAFAEAGKIEHVICSVAVITGLGIAAAERAMMGPDRDTNLILGKALSWSWPVVRAVLKLRPAEEQAEHLLDKSREGFENLSPTTAQRVLRFLVMREEAGRSAFKGGKASSVSA